MAQKIRLEDRECPLSATLGLVGEWWTLLILHDAFDGYTRFDQFQENLGISSSLLTSRLKRLVASGLLERRQYQTNPPRYEYVLTELWLFTSPGHRRPRRVGQRPPRPRRAQHGARRRRNRGRGRARRRRSGHRSTTGRPGLRVHRRPCRQQTVSRPVRSTPTTSTYCAKTSAVPSSQRGHGWPAWMGDHPVARGLARSSHRIRGMTSSNTATPATATGLAALAHPTAGT